MSANGKSSGLSARKNGYHNFKEVEMIGLMGVQNDGKTLVLPGGKVLCKIPSWVAWRIQHIQHWFAKLTWR